jgi:hypothetical protein
MQGWMAAWTTSWKMRASSTRYYTRRMRSSPPATLTPLLLPSSCLTPSSLSPSQRLLSSRRFDHSPPPPPRFVALLRDQLLPSANGMGIFTGQSLVNEGKVLVNLEAVTTCP